VCNAYDLDIDARLVPATLAQEFDAEILSLDQEGVATLGSLGAHPCAKLLWAMHASLIRQRLRSRLFLNGSTSYRLVRGRSQEKYSVSGPAMNTRAGMSLAVMVSRYQRRGP